MNSELIEIGDEMLVVDAPETETEIGAETLVDAPETETKNNNPSPLPGSPEWLKYMAVPAKAGFAEYKALRSRMDATTVECQYQTGRILVAVRGYLPAAKYKQWLKTNVGINGRDLELARQMANIAAVGDRILRYKWAGKNRVLEMIYMLKEMQEYSEANVDSIDSALTQIENTYPFPGNTGDEADDVKKWRVHMDAIITKFRIDRASMPKGGGSVQLVCPFDMAKSFALKRGLAIEKSEADKKVVEWLATDNPTAAMVSWLDAWTKDNDKGSRPRCSDFTRVPEDLARFAEWTAKLLNDASAKSEVLNSEDLLSYVRDVRDSFSALINEKVHMTPSADNMENGGEAA